MEKRDWEVHAWFSRAPGSLFQCCVSKIRKKQRGQPKLLGLPHFYRAESLRRDEILAFNDMLGSHLTEPNTLLLEWQPSPSAVTPTLGNSEEIFRGFGSVLGKQEHPTGWHEQGWLRSARLCQLPWTSSSPTALSQRLWEQHSSLNSSKVIYMNFACKSRCSVICTLVVPTLALSILSSV